MNKNHKLLAAAGMVILCSLSTTVLAQNKKPTTPATAAPAATTPPAAPKKEGIKPFSEVITAKARSKNGLFKTHKVDDNGFLKFLIQS